MKLLKNSEINLIKWENLYKNSIYSTPFQSPDFYHLFNLVDGYSAEVFAVENSNIYLSLVVITIQEEKGLKSNFSRRGIIYGGILMIEKNHDAINILLKNLRNYYSKRLIYIEIRNNSNYSEFNEIFKLNGFSFNQHLNVQLITEGKSFNDILQRMKYNRRREINLSIKEGALVKEATNEDEIKQVYQILKDLYYLRVKLPLPCLDYFVNIYLSEIGKVFIVKHEGKILGGSFCIYKQNNSIFTLYYCGLRDYHKKIFPTHLAIMGVINFAIANELKMVDFMGAGKPGEDYGVKDYKMQFGGELVEHGRYLNVLNPLKFKVGKFGLKLLSIIK